MKYFTDKRHKIKKQYRVPFVQFESVDGQKIDDPKIFVNELLTITKDPRINISIDKWSPSFGIKVWKDGPALKIEHLNQDLFNELINNIKMHLALKDIYNMIKNLPDSIKLKIILTEE